MSMPDPRTMPFPFPHVRDMYDWLFEQSREHGAGCRRTDDIIPEEMWVLADKVAEQTSVLYKDYERIGLLYLDWLDGDLDSQGELEEED